MEYDALPSVIPIGNPAAGAGATLSVPGSERWLLRAVTFKLVTSAVVVTRTPVLEILDGAGGVNVAACSGFGQPASLTTQYTFAHGLAEWDSAGTNFASGPCPSYLLGDGDQLTIHIDAMDAGDTLTAIRFVVVQFPVRDDES